MPLRICVFPDIQDFFRLPAAVFNDFSGYFWYGLAIKGARPMGTSAKTGLWRIKVDEQRCSLCGACAQRCGPAVLALQQAQGQALLLFAAERCHGCGLCVPPCPEEAIQLTETSTPAAAGPAAVLASSPLARCARCGAYSVPSKMLGTMSRWSTQSSEGGQAAAEDYTTCDACRSEMMLTGGVLHA